jgi:hypothetical protein
MGSFYEREDMMVDRKNRHKSEEVQCFVCGKFYRSDTMKQCSRFAEKMVCADPKRCAGVA